MNLIPDFIHRRVAHRPNLLKIFDNIGWLFFDKILRIGVGLVVGVWIARYLGPEQFGQFNFAAAFVGLFGAIAGLGLQGIVVRDIVRDPACKEETLGTAAVLQFIGGLLTYGLILGTIFWLRPDDALAKTLVAILGSTMLFKASQVAIYWFESQVLSKYIVWVQNGTVLVFAAIKVVLILNNAPLTSFAWAIMAEALIVALLMLVLLGLRGPKLRQLRFTLSRSKELLADSWPLLLSGIAIMIYMKIDQIMLGQMVGDEAVGIYSAAVRISEVWYFVPMGLVASVFPTILRAREVNYQAYIGKIQLLYDGLVLFSFSVALTMSFLGEWLVHILFGSDYSASADILVVHTWTGVFVAMGVARGRWLIAENLQHFSHWYILAGMIVNIVGNYLLIPIYEGVGAGVAALFAQITATIIVPYVIRETRVSSIMLVSALHPYQWFIFVRKAHSELYRDAGTP
ncbi:MAG: flippase [Halioglobus sp.]